MGLPSTLDVRKYHTPHSRSSSPALGLGSPASDSSAPGAGVKQSRGIPAQTPAQVALRVSLVPYQGWPAVPASPSGTSGWERRSPWPCAVGHLAWPGPEETGSKAETAWLVQPQGQGLLGTGMEAGTCTCGRLQVLEASFMALRMLPEKAERPEVSTPQQEGRPQVRCCLYLCY